MSTVSEVYRMLGSSAIWETARECHTLLTNASVPYAVVGGVAVCLHGYQRNTIDLDLLVASENADAVKELLIREGYQWRAENVEFVSPQQVPVQFLISGSRAGKGSEVLLPHPSAADAVVQIDDVNVLSLAKLIESKIACGEGNLRRTHKDFADVVELIAHHQLESSFAMRLHKSVRATYRRLVKNARGSV